MNNVFTVGGWYRTTSLYAGKLVIEILSVVGKKIYYKVVANGNQRPVIWAIGCEHYFNTGTIFADDLAPCTPAKKKKEAKPFENTATFDDLFKGE